MNIVIGRGRSHLAYASEFMQCLGVLRRIGFVTHLAEMSLPTVSGLAYRNEYTPKMFTDARTRMVTPAEAYNRPDGGTPLNSCASAVREVSLKVTTPIRCITGNGYVVVHFPSRDSCTVWPSQSRSRASYSSRHWDRKASWSSWDSQRSMVK
jgi:hypothetical protein